MMKVKELLAYYDIFDRPLTREEIDGLPEQYASHREGYFYLFEREYIVPLRKRREEYAKEKWRKAMRVLKWYRLVPFVKIAFVSGSLSLNNTDELSDFDIIIVARHGRIWLVRAMTLALFYILGSLRRNIDHDKYAPNKICPNHFITDQSLLIPFKNIYTAELYRHLVPVIVRDGALLEHFKKENSWVTEMAGEWKLDESRIAKNNLLDFARMFFEWILSGSLGSWLDSVVAKYQKRRIESNQIVPVPGGHLIYNDKMLAFHSGSQAGKILSEFDKRLKLIDKL